MYPEGNSMEAEEQSVNPSISSVPVSSENQRGVCDQVSFSKSMSHLRRKQEGDIFFPPQLWSLI